MHGRGPTRLISPRSTLMSCGNSSKPDARSNHAQRDQARIAAAVEFGHRRICLNQPPAVVPVDGAVGAHPHRAKLVYLEAATEIPDSLLAKKHRPARKASGQKAHHQRAQPEKRHAQEAGGEVDGLFPGREGGSRRCRGRPSVDSSARRSGGAALPRLLQARFSGVMAKKAVSSGELILGSSCPAGNGDSVPSVSTTAGCLRIRSCCRGHGHVPGASPVTLQSGILRPKRSPPVRITASGRRFRRANA